MRVKSTKKPVARQTDAVAATPDRPETAVNAPGRDSGGSDGKTDVPTAESPRTGRGEPGNVVRWREGQLVVHGMDAYRVRYRPVPRSDRLVWRISDPLSGESPFRASIMCLSSGKWTTAAVAKEARKLMRTRGGLDPDAADFGLTRVELSVLAEMFESSEGEIVEALLFSPPEPASIGSVVESDDGA